MRVVPGAGGPDSINAVAWVVPAHGVRENGQNLDATQLQDKYDYQMKTHNFQQKLDNRR